jgi:hypothetical protein
MPMHSWQAQLADIDKSLKEHRSFATAGLGLCLGFQLWSGVMGGVRPETEAFILGTGFGILLWLQEIICTSILVTLFKDALEAFAIEKGSIRVDKRDLMAAIDRNNELLRLLREEAPEFLERHEGVTEGISRSNDYLTAVVNSLAVPPHPAKDRTPGGD